MSQDLFVSFPEKEADATWKVRTLTRLRQKDGVGYTREADVDAQIGALSALNDRTRRARLLAEPAAWGSRERVREETLVYFVREYARRGDEETAWAIIEALIARTDAHVARKMARWRLTGDETDDCTRDLYTVLCSALLDTSGTAEFWEVRFWVCLDRRLWNLLEKRQATADLERSAGDEQGGEEIVEERLTRIADTSPTPEMLAEYEEAKAQLSDKELMALQLVYLEGLPEESEDPNRMSAAKVMGVTGRSVRNYLKRAKEKLRKWHEGDD